MREASVQSFYDRCNVIKERDSMAKLLTPETLLAVIHRIPEVRLMLGNGVVLEFTGTAVAQAIQTALDTYPDLIPAK